jgi:hypothetical protein
MPEAPTSGPSPRTLITLIFLGLLLWGIYIAIGVWWQGLNPLGALVVLVCVGIFMSIWWLLLKSQHRDDPRDS